MTRSVDIARTWIGTPYHHQQAAKGFGCDCLGLLRGIYQEMYPDVRLPKVPAYSPFWISEHTRVKERELLLNAALTHLHPLADQSQAKVGDMILIRMHPKGPFKHCAIISGIDPLIIIHSYEGSGVVEMMYPQNWRNKETRYFRFPEKR